MLNKWPRELTLLHQAVIEENLELLHQYSSSEWRYYGDRYGFTPLELSQLLGRQECQQLLQTKKKDSFSIKVQFKGQKNANLLSLVEFEESFKITYRPFLTFSSYEILLDVIHQCPYLLQIEKYLNSQDEQEAFYQSRINQGFVADVVVKWMNPTLGYGLFADIDLPEKALIGEYTGQVRRIDTKKPNLNAYCFHYPTRFWSRKYYAIDALHEGNVLRFINHSDYSNLQPVWLVDRGLLHLILITKRFVPKGTELTFDYGPDYWIHRKKAAKH